MAKVKIGIEGMDEALDGGIPEGNIVLVSGGAGTGKSTFCLQFLMNGAAQFGEKSLYISTEQDPEELHRQADKYGWKLDDLEKKGLLKLVYFDITANTDFFNSIQQLVAEFKPKRIVVDSLTTLTDTLLISGAGERESIATAQLTDAVSSTPRSESILAKSILFHLIKELKGFEVTTLLTSELKEDSKELSADGISEFITDGVILMHYIAVGVGDYRTMLVRKMRYGNYNKDIIPYSITEKGITLVDAAAEAEL